METDAQVLVQESSEMFILTSRSLLFRAANPHPCFRPGTLRARFSEVSADPDGAIEGVKPSRTSSARGAPADQRLLESVSGYMTDRAGTRRRLKA